MKKLFISFCVLYGCGGLSADEVCDQRAGTYRAEFSESSGNCGYLPDQIFTVTKQPETVNDVSPLCTGSIDYSDNNCRVTVDTTCPGATGYNIVQRGKADWSQDGSNGVATLQFMVLDAYTDFALCSSVYEVVYNRI